MEKKVSMERVLMMQRIGSSSNQAANTFLETHEEASDESSEYSDCDDDDENDPREYPPTDQLKLLTLIKQGDVDGVKSILGLPNAAGVAGDRGNVDFDCLNHCVEPLPIISASSSSSSPIEGRRPKDCNRSYGKACRRNEFCGCTALSLAVKNQHVDIVRLLLDNGASNNASHMIDATKFPNVDILRLLVSHGADVNTFYDEFDDIHQTCHPGNTDTLLCFAAFEGGEASTAWGSPNSDGSEYEFDDIDDDNTDDSDTYDSHEFSDDDDDAVKWNELSCEQLHAIRASLPPYEDNRDDEEEDSDDDDASDLKTENIVDIHFQVENTKSKRIMNVIRFLVEEVGVDVNSNEIECERRREESERGHEERKRRLIEENTRERERYCISIPSICCACDDPLTKNTVAFTCECLTGFCGSCALEQIANQPSAYSRGVNCVVCRQPSDNIQGKEACKAAEDQLVEAAAVHYGVRIRTSGPVPSLEKLLEKLHADGYVGTVTSLSHLRDPEEAEHMIRLDIARLEYARELLLRQQPEQRASSSGGCKKRARDDATTGLSFLKDNDADLALSAEELLSNKEKRKMFLGPMKLLKVSRNVALERAIEMQRLLASNI